MGQVELTDKEQALIWGIICWFDKPISGTLKSKLYAPQNNKILKKYDTAIEDRLINTANWIQQRRDKSNG